MQLHADMLFLGGPIYTADPHGPRWVEAVAVGGGRIMAIGRAEDLVELQGPRTEVVNLAGRLLLPGFTESHIHFVELALRAVQIDVTSAASAGEVAAAVRDRVAAVSAAGHGAELWIRGGGWNANTWVDGVAPHRRVLDAVAPQLPVVLDSKELHGVWANSVALRRAGIDASTPDVPGGVIERDEDGEPTGILRENAVELVTRVMPRPGLAETTAAVRQAIPSMWQAGIVAIHNANDSGDGLSFQTYQALQQAGDLRLRVLQHIPSGNLPHARALGLRSGFGDAWLRIGGVKMFADGALGSRTANMLQPYEGDPGNWGVAATDPEEMLEQAMLASQAGLSLTIHAIGDRANRDVLNILAEVRAAEGDRRLRHRIEHVQCIHDDDLPRLAQLGIIGSVQPIHATSDIEIVDRYWGAGRARGAYAFRRLLDSGARLVFGSDGPIEPHDPRIGIHAAVTRTRAGGSPGPEGWQPQERLTVAEAVDAYTYWPAYAAGEEGYRGCIRAGHVADLVVLSEDIFSIEPQHILDAPIDLTVLDGGVVWRRW